MSLWRSRTSKVMHKDALIIVQARIKSKRLPGKTLLPLRGIPMLAYLLRRLKILQPDYSLAVATTDCPEDDRIAILSNQEGVEVVRGDEDDVLSRYVKCLNTFNPEIAVRVTGDNPLTDTDLIQKVIKIMKDEKFEYVRAVEGFVKGTGVDAFQRDAIHRLSHLSGLSAFEREHIDTFILRNWGSFKAINLSFLGKKEFNNLNFTVNTLQDYHFVKKIIESFPQGEFIRIEDAIRKISA